MKIGILDGAQTAASSLQKLLEENSLQAEIFSSFAAAEQHLNGFNILIADFMLPDIQGAPLLESLAKKTDSKTWFLFVSAVFNELQFKEILPKSLENRSFFLKKPIGRKELEEKLDQIRQSLEPVSDNSLFNQNKAAGFWNPDLASSLLKAGEAGRAQEADSRFLIPALVNLNRDGFSGFLIVESGGEEVARIIFQSGGIVQMSSKNANSLFGALLIEHGFALQEEIKEVLHSSQKDKKIGAKLLEKGFLSPHVVHLILREQIKIRLSDLISEGGFISMRTAAAKKALETEKDSGGILEFQTRDILDWTVGCIQTKFSEAYWDKFYEQNKRRRLRPLKAVPAALLKNKGFANQYNRLFSETEKLLSLEELLRRSGMKKRIFSEAVFFAALSRSVVLSPLEENGGEQSRASAEAGKGDGEAVRKLAEAFLQRNPRELFETLHLPWKAPVSEVRKHYKMIVSRFHPDRLPKDADDRLKDMCRRILQQAGNANDMLSDAEKRSKYIEEKEAKNLAEVMSIYQKGIAFLKQRSFNEALEQFHSIKNSSFCPKEIALYILQAEIQTLPDPLKDSRKSGEMREKISRVPIELHVSSLFWFVSGLFYARIGQYEKAASFFKKVIATDKRQTEASRELLKIKKEIKRQSAQYQDKKPGLLQKLFPLKKSA